MALLILRVVFLVVCLALAFRLSVSEVIFGESMWLPWFGFLSVLTIAVIVLLIDSVVRRKRLETISAVYFGIFIGLVLTYVLQLVLTPLLPAMTPALFELMSLFLGTIVCYACISVLLQTKDDFRFIIPYVEFAKEVKGLMPYVLDTSVVIDGRIADVVETRVIDNQLIMPQFVIAELQGIADSSEKLRRGRGRRGLDILNRLRNDPEVDLQIFDRELPQFSGKSVDQKLVLLAKHLQGKVVTNDYNLNKVAKLHDVGVINLNDIANALKPVFLPGEDVQVRIVKAGEEMGQGVGYLEDGTMVVIEGARSYVGQNVSATVTSVLQTSAGRMVFGRYDSTSSNDQQESRSPERVASSSPPND